MSVRELKISALLLTVITAGIGLAQASGAQDAPKTIPQAPVSESGDPNQFELTVKARGDSAVAAAKQFGNQPARLQSLLPQPSLLATDLDSSGDGSIRPSDYPDAVAYYSQFCRNQIYTLQWAKRDAAYQAAQYQYASAYSTLSQAVNVAAAQIRQGFTAQALTDSIELGNLLKAKFEQGPAPGEIAFPASQVPKQLYHYLDNFVDFVIAVHYNLDSYFVPWMSCRFCEARSPWRVREFGDRIAQFAREELLSVVDESVDDVSSPISTRDPYRYRAFPAGKPEAAMAAIAKAAHWTAGGLATSGLGNWYSCVISDLESIGAAIDHLPQTFQSQQDAVQIYPAYVRSLAEQIVKFDPRERGGCGGWTSPQRPGPNGPHGGPNGPHGGPNGDSHPERWSYPDAPDRF